MTWINLIKKTLSALLKSASTLNAEGHEKAAEYLDDLCASGKYKKLVGMSWITKRYVSL